MYRAGKPFASRGRNERLPHYPFVAQSTAKGFGKEADGYAESICGADAVGLGRSRPAVLKRICHCKLKFQRGLIGRDGQI